MSQPAKWLMGGNPPLLKICNKTKIHEQNPRVGSKPLIFVRVDGLWDGFSRQLGPKWDGFSRENITHNVISPFYHPQYCWADVFSENPMALLVYLTTPISLSQARLHTLKQPYLFSLLRLTRGSVFTRGGHRGLLDGPSW